MYLNIRAFLYIVLSIMTCLIFVNGCSLEDADIVRAPIPEDLVIKRERERREALGDSEDESFVGNRFKDITGLGKDKNRSSGRVSAKRLKIILNTFQMMKQKKF